MTDQLEFPDDDAGRSTRARFFLRIGQVGNATAARDEETLPLFPITLIMAAEGLLSRDAAEILGLTVE